MPSGARRAWRAFSRLRARAGSSGFGALPISWSDIDAFLRHARLTLTPFEIELLEDIDNLFLAAQSAKPQPD